MKKMKILLVGLVMAMVFITYSGCAVSSSNNSNDEISKENDEKKEPDQKDDENGKSDDNNKNEILESEEMKVYKQLLQRTGNAVFYRPKSNISYGGGTRNDFSDKEYSVQFGEKEISIVNLKNPNEKEIIDFTKGWKFINAQRTDELNGVFQINVSNGNNVSNENYESYYFLYIIDNFCSNAELNTQGNYTPSSFTTDTVNISGPIFNNNNKLTMFFLYNDSLKENVVTD